MGRPARLRRAEAPQPIRAVATARAGAERRHEQRFYHCADCADPDLFDLCVECCGAVYLKQGTPEAQARCRLQPHPTHVIATHRMVQVAI